MYPHRPEWPRTGGSRRGPGSAATLATVAAVSMALLTGLTAGCSSRIDDVPAAPVKAKPVSSAPLSAEDQAAVDAAWAAYQKLNEIYVKAAQTGVYQWDADATKQPMYEYAAGYFLSALEQDLDLMQEQGLIRTGAPKVTLRRVVSVSPNSILVESCVDDTATDTVSKATGKSVAVPGQNKKYPVTLRAGLYPDGVWRWVESHADRGTTC